MSCQNTNTAHGQDFETYEYVPQQTIESRDKQYILYTIKQFIKQDFYTYGYYEQFGLAEEKVKYEVERIFYSPDKLKMVAWIFYTVPNNEDYAKENQDYYYNAEAIIGFREQPNAPWIIYPFHQFEANGFSVKNKLKNQMGQYYFDKMAEDAQYVMKIYIDENYGGEVRYDLEEQRKKLDYGNSDTGEIEKNFGYNLDDTEFWEKSLVWQKGAYLPNYYNFQLYGTKVWELPQIVYPEEILSQYD